MRINCSKFSLILLVFLPILSISQKTNQLTEEELKSWWQKDLENDSIPGIGLDRVYDELIKNRKGQEVIVAVLDTKLDIDHEDLKDQIWVNKGEIPDNGIDDDNNGYVDDVNGWNFMGNNKGEDVITQKEEPARIVAQYKNYFGNDNTDTLDIEKKKLFKEYTKAKNILDKEVIELEKLIKSSDSLNTIYYKAKDTIRHFTSNKNYDFETIDSLRTIHPEMEEYFELLSLALQYGLKEQDLIDQQNYLKTQKKAFDINFNGRKVLNDNPNDLTDVPYGNNKVKNNKLTFQHSILVTGIIASVRGNGIGINGFSNSIKIMPVVMVAEGDEHDKEVALGIKYAVDNGARIINMSWGKYQSLHEEWVQEAFKYAEKHNVLLVAAAGNALKNIDIEIKYPNDQIDGVEFVDNYIVTGGITKNMDSTLVSDFSNYGNMNVDIFAPASDIYTLGVNHNYETTSGTSLAGPKVTGTAALLKSYFPKLTSVQLKEIILKSGTELDMMVKRPGDTENSPLVPFSSLSKTGAILNTYAAFRLASEMSD